MSLAMRATRSLRAARAVRRVSDVASAADVSRGSVREARNILLAERALPSPAFVPQGRRLAVEASRLFCGSDPLHHTASDVGRYFQFDGATTVFDEVFYHHGLLGEHFRGAATRLRSSALMVREAGLRLRDELLEAEARGGLAAAPPLMVDGPAGCGKSALLNYAVACCHQAGWLVVVVPYAADWTMGLSARTVQWPNEAYRLADSTYFKQLPPRLRAEGLYEAPDASYNFLLSHALSQQEKFGRVLIKDEERKAYYAPHAADAAKGPTLADLLRMVLEDATDSFEEFPVAVRPVYDFLEELKTATEVPVLLVVDGWNRFHQMASSTQWNSPVPLHGQQLLVPRILGDLQYGEQMANGIMLGAVTRSSARPLAVPLGLRKFIPPPFDFSRPRSLPPSLRKALRKVTAYSFEETQRALEFYAYAGHIQNPGLENPLRTGELNRKVHLMTAGVGSDVFKLCEQM